jgi:lysyl-tRNA synthetase class 2
MTQPDWRPACDLSVLHVRAAMLTAARSVFRQVDYLEVETPCLSRDIVLDSWIDPFELSIDGQRWFLQTSPEAHMKRLLAAGAGSIFQVSRVFRRGEAGSRHNPEFTMIEWYGVGSSRQEQMQLTEQLVRRMLVAADAVTGRRTPVSPAAFATLTWQAAFQDRYGIDALQATAGELRATAAKHGVSLPESLESTDRDGICNVLLAAGIEPQLGGRGTDGSFRPVFLHDYPPSQAALAVVSESEPHLARRFELYIDGLELCNGYQELTDPTELRRREAAQQSQRSIRPPDHLPGAPRLAAAMHHGLPACSGVALGFDRLVMLATGATAIDAVLPFPFDRA